MYSNVIFYNRNHNGDIFESREFIKAMMNIIPAYNYYYLHSNSTRILSDIPNIKQIQVTDWPDLMPNVGLLHILDTNVCVNTWIGNGKYGCLVENNYDMFNSVLDQLNLHNLPGTPYDYLPEVGYGKYYTSWIDRFIADMKYSGDLILIDNGDVLSLQADNFDFEPIILRLADEHKDKTFITTKPLNKIRLNVWYTGGIIKSPFDNDLIEIGYLARKCKLIVGRNSGPFVFSCTKENLNDVKKTFISFCYEARVATFHVNQAVQSKQVWSGSTDANDIFNVINNEIGV